MFSRAGGRAYLNYLSAKHNAFESTALKAIPLSRVVHRYPIVIGGVSMLVPEDEIDKLAKLPGVVRVYRDKLEQPDTDRSPQFIGANILWTELGGQDMAGEGVIVGVIDTGVWPEHASFADPDLFGNSYSAPPVVPGSNGFVGTPDPCNFGNTGFNPNDVSFTCNNKHGFSLR